MKRITNKDIRAWVDSIQQDAIHKAKEKPTLSQLIREQRKIAEEHLKVAKEHQRMMNDLCDKIDKKLNSLTGNHLKS